MGGRETFLDLAARGIRLAAQGDRLVARPASRLTDEDRDAIRQHRASLLRLLAQGPQVHSDPATNPSCAQCPPATPVRTEGATAGDAWCNADAAYRRHQWACPDCSPAGRGYGSRCPDGARLWAACTAQRSLASHKLERQPQGTSAEPPPQSFEGARRL